MATNNIKSATFTLVLIGDKSTNKHGEDAAQLLKDWVKEDTYYILINNTTKRWIKQRFAEAPKAAAKAQIEDRWFFLVGMNIVHKGRAVEACNWVDMYNRLVKIMAKVAEGGHKMRICAPSADKGTILASLPREGLPFITFIAEDAQGQLGMDLASAMQAVAPEPADPSQI